MCKCKYIAGFVFMFLINLFMSLNLANALLYNFEDPKQLNDFVIDEGDWSIKNGVLEGRLPAKDYLGVHLAYPESEEWSDYTLEVRGTWLEDLGQAGQSAQVEIFFRFVEPQNRYFLDANYVLNNSGLYAQIGGDWPELGPRTPVEGIPDEKTHDYKIELKGESIIVFVDGNVIFDVKDNRIAKGTVGLGGYGSRVQYDNLRIEGVGLPKSAVQAHSKLATCWGDLKKS